MIGGFPVIVLGVLVGLGLMVLVLVLTTNDKPPRFHAALAFVGFVASVVW